MNRDFIESNRILAKINVDLKEYIDNFRKRFADMQLEIKEIRLYGHDKDNVYTVTYSDDIELVIDNYFPELKK